MGAQSTDAALTESWGGPAAAGARLYVGIDIGRHSHLVAAIPKDRMEDGSWERGAVRRVSTTAGGFADLTVWLDSFGVPRAATVAGCEPTGGWYGWTVVAYLENAGYRVHWLQNWAIHDRRKLLIGKQTKTDALDARLLARLLYEQEWLGANKVLRQHPPQRADALRLLVRNRLKLVLLSTRYRAQLGVIIDVLFPELKVFFRTTTTGAWARALLEQFPSPAALSSAQPDAVAHVWVQHRANRLVPRVPEVQALAASSAGLPDAGNRLLPMQGWLLRQIRLVDQEIQLAEAAIAQALEAWPSEDRVILASLPGMSTLRQATLLCCIGDVRSFPSDRQLRKMLGWYPEARESGASISQHRLGQTGIRLARREIWLWAFGLLSPKQSSTPFRAYYQRLRARGMPGKVALGHVAGKLISVLFYCLRHRQPYDAARHARDLGFPDA